MGKYQRKPRHHKKGFASMSKARVKELASLGGRTSHAKGTAHKWTRAEARAAGKKGGKKKGGELDASEQQNNESILKQLSETNG